MLYPVYECDDFHWEDDILFIYKAKLVAMIKTHEDFNEIYKSLTYDALVCPQLVIDEKGTKPRIVLFK